MSKPFHGYWKHTNKGLAIIVPKNEGTPGFKLYLGTKLLRHNYRDPWQAAADLHDGDVGLEEMNVAIKGVRVTADLDQWNTTPPPENEIEELGLVLLERIEPQQKPENPDPKPATAKACCIKIGEAERTNLLKKFAARRK